MTLIPEQPLSHINNNSMKTSKQYWILFPVLIMLIFTTCTKKEAQNPFDAGCPKELFTPANFKSEMSGTSVKLSWTQENLTINGFVINRSENGTSATEVARVDKSITIWTDTKVSSGLKYDYTIYAYAGANLSNALTTSITTPALGATVTTNSAASAITPNSAILGGNVTADGGSSVTERGICYGTSANPSISNSKAVMGNGTGAFSGTISGLAGNTTYYAKAYATNSYGTTYGTEVSFTTTQLLAPTLTTTAATSITAISAVLGGNVTNDGNSPVIETGVCYSLTENSTTSNSKVPIGTGTGAFSKAVTGLTEGTIYYVRAYAINSVGISYGTQISFTTTPLQLATVSTSVAANLTGTTAVLGGIVTNDGNAAVTERGVCYAITQAPTTTGTKIVIGTGTGAFSNTVTGLTDGTKYYARAYATNSKGTAYGDEISFTTSQISLATVTTAVAGTIGSSTAILGGSVPSDGNSTVTERGVCYSISQNPTTANSKLAIGTGTGSFSNTVSGLTGSTTYYVRAYATNAKGTAYGNEISFKTNVLISLATLTTSATTNITINNAMVGGNITNDGGATVIERGICYNTSGNPTTNSPKVIVGYGLGAFSTTISNLDANTTYQVRAYAINSVGTSYGNLVSFTTMGNVPTVTTKDVVSILETNAVAGGIVLTDEGASVTERGVCYGTSTNPTIYDSKIASGSGLGGFNIPLSTLIPNMNYYTRAYATNKNGTAYGENKTFKTLDAYYAGFENGIPAGWSSMWAVSTDSPYEGFSCLKSVNKNDSIVFNQTILNSDGGQIKFYYRAPAYSPNGFTSYAASTSFYIDNKLQANFNDGVWTIKTYPITSGKHKFKWINTGSAYINTAYIDYFIGPK